MKRSYSLSLSPEPDVPISQNIPSSPATPKKPKALPKSRDVAHSPTKKSGEQSGTPGAWTSEARAAMLGEIISSGMAAIGSATLAEKVSTSPHHGWRRG